MAKKESKKQKKLFFITASLALVVILIIALLLLTTPSGDVAATVNGEVITQAHLDSEYDSLPAQYKSLMTKDAFLDQMIEQKLLVQEAERQGIVASQNEINAEILTLSSQFPTQEVFEEVLSEQNLTLEDLNNQIKEQLLIQELLDREVLSQIEITDEEIETYYTANKEQFTAGDGEIHAAHILVSTEEEALEVKSLLDSGRDFSALALERSNDPSAAVNSGDLGFFGKGIMVAPFEEAAFSLSIGEVSLPVETQFGYHIIKRLPATISLSDASNQIKTALLREKQGEAIDSYLATLKKNADISKGSVGVPKQKTAINSFKATQDDTCLEDEKPVIRMYTATSCATCSSSLEILSELVPDSSVVLKVWELDTGDNLATPATESALTQAEYDLLQKYNPEHLVPFYNFGCEYIRTGIAQTPFDATVESTQFSETLSQVMS